MSTTIALDHPDATAAVQQGFEAEEHKTRHPIAVIFHFLFKVRHEPHVTTLLNSPFFFFLFSFFRLVLFFGICFQD